MVTAHQIEANRKNAQKATGPRTAAGRATSSQNALKTGIHAQSEIIRTESQTDYDFLIAEYYERFRPAAPEERALVDDLIRAEWLGRRYMQATAKLWGKKTRSSKTPPTSAEPSAASLPRNEISSQL